MSHVSLWNEYRREKQPSTRNININRTMKRLVWVLVL